MMISKKVDPPLPLAAGSDAANFWFSCWIGATY